MKYTLFQRLLKYVVDNFMAIYKVRVHYDSEGKLEVTLLSHKLPARDRAIKAFNGASK